MTELVECNTQLHKTLQGLWSDALTEHKLQQHYYYIQPSRYTAEGCIHDASSGHIYMCMGTLRASACGVPVRVRVHGPGACVHGD